MFLLFFCSGFRAWLLCWGVIDKCFARVCVSRVQIRGFLGVLWLIFCVCSCRILFLCGEGVDFFVLVFLVFF